MRHAAAPGPVPRPVLLGPQGLRYGSVQRRYQAIGLGLAASDTLCVIAALNLAYSASFGGHPRPVEQLLMVTVVPLVWLGVFNGFALYALPHLSPADEFRRIVGAAGVGMVLLVMAGFWLKSSFSRSWVGLSWILVLLLELITRRAWRWYEDRLKLDGRLAFRTLIIGTSTEAVQLVRTLRAPGSGFVPIGYVHLAKPQVSGDSLPVVGELGGLQELIRDQQADCLFVASTAVDVEEMALTAHAARLAGVEVRVSANMSHTLTSRVALQQVGPMIALALRPVRLTRRQVAFKRVFDLVVGSVALLGTLPLWAVTALAIRLSSRGPVLFHQERVTKGGRVFRMHKFRTMEQGNSGALARPAVPVDLTAPFFKLGHDPRVTRVGRLVRRLSLDELPQFWNVLKGEMSLVGPRPLPADQVSANLELLGPRHEVLAGVTGWWQVHGRGLVTAEEAVRLDMFYIENWSLSLDLYILLKTFWAVIASKGAR